MEISSSMTTLLATATYISFIGNANCEGAGFAVSLPLQCYLTTDPNAFQYANELKCDQSNSAVTFPQNSAYVVEL